jgi:hypothetical protein
VTGTLVTLHASSHLNPCTSLSQVDPVRVRRAAATSRLFMQRILQQFGALGRPGGGSDDEEWEEDEGAEEGAEPARQRRRAGAGRTAQRPVPPQVSLNKGYSLYTPPDYSPSERHRV